MSRPQASDICRSHIGASQFFSDGRSTVQTTLRIENCCHAHLLHRDNQTKNYFIDVLFHMYSLLERTSMHALATPFGSSAESIVRKDKTLHNLDGFRAFAIRLALHSRLLRLSSLSCKIGPSFLLMANGDVQVRCLPAHGWQLRKKVEDRHKRFTTGKKYCLLRIASGHRDIVSRFAPDSGLLLEGIADNLDVLRNVALFTFVCGVMVLNYFANKQCRKKDSERRFSLQEAKVSLCKWILVSSPTPFNRFVITRCPSISTDQLSPIDETSSAHLQIRNSQIVSLSTVVPHNLFIADSSEKKVAGKSECKLREIEYQRYCLPTPDGGVVALDWPRHLDLAGEHELDTTLLLIPGTVKGSLDEGLQIVVQRALLSGYFPVVLNPRGCGGSPITTPRLFTPGDSDDVKLAANYVAESRPWATIMSIGWGLGANMLTKYLGKEADSTLISAAVSINNPFNMELATRASVDNDSNQFERELTDGYVQILRANKLLFQGHTNKFDVSKGLTSTSLREFDSAISMVSRGFCSLEDFYLDGISSVFLQRLKVPLLCIQGDNLIPTKFLPQYLFDENPFLTLLLPCLHEGQIVSPELTFISSTHQEQLIIAFEWLSAVELALLKKRHPSIHGTVAVRPAQGPSFKSDNGITDRRERAVDVVDLGSDSEEFSMASESSESQFPGQEFSNYSVIQSIDIPSVISLEQCQLQSKPAAANVSQSIEHVSLSPSSNFNHDMDNEHNESVQKSEVRHTLENVLNAIDSTMPGILSAEGKEQVLVAVERGKTIISALQEAVPEDVRGKMIDAVFGAVQARGISFKLVGIGKGVLPSSLSEGVKKMVQDNLAAIAWRKDQDHHCEDKIICEHPNHDVQETCQKLDEDGTGGQRTDSNQKIKVEKSDGQSRNQLEVVTDERLINSNDLVRNRSHECSSKEDPLGGKGNTDGGEISEDKIMNETAVKGDPAVAAKDATDGGERLDGKSEEEDLVTELNRVQNIESGNGVQKNGNPDSIHDSTDQIRKESLNMDTETEIRGDEMQSAGNFDKTQEGPNASSMPTLPNRPTTSSPVSSFPPAVDMQKTLEALTGIDDSTQVAVTNVFGLIENMIEQLGKEKHSDDLLAQKELSSLHSTDDSLSKLCQGEDTGASVEHTTESNPGNKAENEYCRLSGGSNVRLSEDHTSEYENGLKVEAKFDSLQKAEESPVRILNPVKGLDQQNQDDFKAGTLEQDLHARTGYKDCQNVEITDKLQEHSSRNTSKFDNYLIKKADFAEVASSERNLARHLRTWEADSLYQGNGAFKSPFRNRYEEFSGYGSSQRASPLNEQHGVHANHLQYEESQQADSEVTTLDGSELIPSFIFKNNVHLSFFTDDMEPGLITTIKESDTYSNERSEESGEWSECIRTTSAKRYPSKFLATQRIVPVERKESCFSNVVHKLALDALRPLILRRLEFLGLKSLGADMEEDIITITDAVAQEAYRSEWAYESQMLLKEKASKLNCKKLRLKVAEFDKAQAQRFQVLPVDVVVRAVSSSYSKTYTLQRLVTFGVVVGVILSALGSVLPIMEVEWEQEQLMPDRSNLQTTHLERVYETSMGNLKIQNSYNDLVGNCKIVNEGTYEHAGSKLSNCGAVDVVGRSFERENNRALLHDGSMVGAVPAAMRATSTYATHRLDNVYADEQDRTMTTVDAENQAQKNTECKEVEIEVSKESFVSTIAEKALAVAKPVVPTNEDGKVDHDRLVSMLAGLGQRGGMLRFIGKAALLWGGLRGAMSLTDRLLIFFHISDRPLGERLLGFAGMAVLLWSPIMIPLLPNFFSQWASRSPSCVAGCASITGLYGAVLILITIWGKRIRGYEHPLEQYGLQIFSHEKLKSLLAGAMLGLFLVLALYFTYGLLGYVQFLKAQVLGTHKVIPALLLTCWHLTKLIGQGVGIGFAVAVVEEVLFRSWLQEEIAVDLGYHKSVLLSGLAFAIFHWSLPAIPGLWLLALALSGARARTDGQLAVPIGIHAGLIATHFVVNVGGLVRYVPSAPAWVTGRHAGSPLAGMLGISMVAVLALILYPWKHHDRFKRGHAEGLSVE